MGVESARRFLSKRQGTPLSRELPGRAACLLLTASVSPFNRRAGATLKRLLPIAGKKVQPLLDLPPPPPKETKGGKIFRSRQVRLGNVKGSTGCTKGLTVGNGLHGNAGRILPIALLVELNHGTAPVLLRRVQGVQATSVSSQLLYSSSTERITGRNEDTEPIFYQPERNLREGVEGEVTPPWATCYLLIATYRDTIGQFLFRPCLAICAAVHLQQSRFGTGSEIQHPENLIFHANLWYKESLNHGQESVKSEKRQLSQRICSWSIVLK